ncbi:MAG: S41 family peptidase [Bacteroidales bacterium]|nr:S41 family peptidase [Bacteroidales bacterium]
MKDINRILLPITTFLLGAAIALFVAKRLNHNHLADAPGKQKFDEVLSYVDRFYCDDVSEEKLFAGAIQGMLQTLDPHSVYSSAEENKQFMESLGGGFEGVGIQFNIMNDTVMVIAVTSGGPSEKAGIMAGDRIVTVNGQNIAGVHIAEDRVFKILRGQKGTKVTIGILRPGTKEVKRYNVIRDKISTSTLDVAYMLNDHVGYIKLNQFGEKTYEEFYSAVSSLKNMGMSSLVLDLRGNGGGYLGAAIKICDAFLPKNEMIVYTEGKNTSTEEVRATAAGCFEKGKLVVLIDEFSASASEIVAGAVQDNDRGWVIGRRSFGKGLVQQQFDMDDGSSLRLTIARYHTPSGRCIQRKYTNGTNDYYEDLLRRYENGELDSEDSIKMDKSLKYKTKKGRVVYGGGGIMPDYFVPIDRDSSVLAFNEVFNTGLVTEFAFNYTTQHRAQLTKAYPNAHAFVKNMTPSSALVQEFVSFYQKKNGKLNLNDASMKELKLWLKAMIGRNLYKENAFYPVANSSDRAIKKALEVLK